MLARARCSRAIVLALEGVIGLKNRSRESEGRAARLENERRAKLRSTQPKRLLANFGSHRSVGMSSRYKTDISRAPSHAGITQSECTRKRRARKVMKSISNNTRTGNRHAWETEVQSRNNRGEGNESSKRLNRAIRDLLLPREDAFFDRRRQLAQREQTSSVTRGGKTFKPGGPSPSRSTERLCRHSVPFFP